MIFADNVLQLLEDPLLNSQAGQMFKAVGLPADTKVLKIVVEAL